MKTLLQNTVQLMVIFILPFIIYTGLLIGSELNPVKKSQTNNNSEVIFELEDEQYIDDIPFDTEHIAATVKYLHATNKDFNFEDEASKEDIPFDTYRIANGAQNQLTLIR